MSETYIESEKKLERRLVTEIKRRGGIAIKLTSQFSKGEPDRLCLIPDEPAFFVEVKSTGEKPTPIQLHRHKKIREIGFKVFIIDSTEKLENLLRSRENSELDEYYMKNGITPVSGAGIIKK